MQSPAADAMPVPPIGPSRPARTAIGGPLNVGGLPAPSVTGRRAWAGLALLVLLAAFLPRPVFLICVLAPCAEETVFRLGLQAQLLRRRVPAWAAVGVTALAFSAVHGLSRSWPLALAVFVPALLLGVLYHRHRSVVACAAVHAAMNWVWLAWAPGRLA